MALLLTRGCQGRISKSPFFYGPVPRFPVNPCNCEDPNSSGQLYFIFPTKTSIRIITLQVIDELFYTRNHLQHTLMHQVYIPLDRLSTMYNTKEMDHQSSRYWCFMAVTYLSSRHGCIKYETKVISALEFHGLKTLAKCQQFAPPLLVFLSPMFFVAFEHHIFSHFPGVRALFLSPPAVPSYQTTHILRQIYLNVCDRRLTTVSSIRMGCPSASLHIGDRGPAPHILRCRRNVCQCSMPHQYNTLPILSSFIPR